MSEAEPPERIPLPPILLSIIPWLAAGLTATLVAALFPNLGGLAAVLSAIVVFGVVAAWMARRVRRDDT